MANKYLDDSGLSQVAEEIKSKFAPIEHKHIVDSSLSSTSENPVQNKVLNEIFVEISNILDEQEASITSNKDSIASHTNDSTKHITSDERTKWNAAKTHADSAHAPADAQKNQNAFSNVIVGSTNIAADSTTDTLTIDAGTGISITGDATNDKVTIANAGVRSVATGSTNGTISVNTNGTSANVAVKGLGSAAYTESSAYAPSSHGTHVSYSSTAPLMDGVASVGNASTVSRSDHRHPSDSTKANIDHTHTPEEIGADKAGSADTALTQAKSYTKQQIDAIVGEGASTTLDTIGEISAAIEENQEVLDLLNTAVGAKAPTNHASSESQYGVGTDSNYGHVKLSDSTNSSSAVSAGIAATPKAVKSAYDLANSAQSTAGSTDTPNKLFLIGATSQDANPQTYSHDTAYVGTNGHLYSNSVQVVNLSDSQALTNKTYNGYTLADACAKGVTDSSSAGAIGTGTNLVTERDVYYGLPTINGAHNYTSGTTLFAPTSVGTSGQVLTSNGSGAPSWVAQSDLVAGKATVLETGRTIRTNLASTSSASFNGSENVTPGVTGILPVANGGTGASTTLEAQYNLLKDMNSATSAMSDTTQFVFKYASPSTSQGSMYYRTGDYVWNYINGKISSDLGLTASSYGGNAVSVGKEWTTPTTVGSYSRLCKFTQYGNWLLHISLSQTAQVSYYTFVVGLSHMHGNISQIANVGYASNSSQSVRLVRDASNAMTFYFELLNSYGANSATATNCTCRLIPISNSSINTVTHYTAYTATSSSDTVVCTLNCQYNAIVSSKFKGDLIGNADSATSATSATKLATARTVSLTGAVTGSGSFDGSANLSIATTQTPYIHSATGTAGTSGYVHIATLKVSGTYQNAPIVIELSKRGHGETCTLNILFASVNSTDPTLDSFILKGRDYGCYLHKSATSTWNLYVAKSEAYDNIGVVRYHKPAYMSGVSVTWTNIHASSVPSGAYAAVGRTYIGGVKLEHDSTNKRLVISVS